MQQSFLEEAEPAGRPHEYEIPAGGKLDRCKSCNAEIIWASTPMGRAVPLAIATVQTRNGKKFAVSHFRDCPDAKEWGRAK